MNSTYETRRTGKHKVAIYKNGQYVRTVQPCQLNTWLALDKAAEAHSANGNLDQAARIELAREYFTNPTFAKALANHLWQAAT